MKKFFVLFAVCVALALAQDNYDEDGLAHGGDYKLPADLVVTIADDRDSVPAGEKYQYSFVVKNVRASSQSATGTELTIDFDDRLTIDHIDYRCMQIEQGAEPDNYQSDSYNGDSYSNNYKSYNSYSSKYKRSLKAASQDSYDSNYEITKDDKVYTCYLGRVSALGTQVVLATVTAPAVNDIITTEADVVAQNEGQWVTDNNRAKEETAVFDDVFLNRINRLQLIENRPNTDFEVGDPLGGNPNAWLCRFGANDEKSLEQDVCDESGNCLSFFVSAWVRCFGLNPLLSQLEYETISKVCDCYSSLSQNNVMQAPDGTNFVCQCAVACNDTQIMVGGGCEINSAEDVALLLNATQTNTGSGSYKISYPGYGQEGNYDSYGGYAPYGGYGGYSKRKTGPIGVWQSVY